MGATPERDKKWVWEWMLYIIDILSMHDRVRDENAMTLDAKWKGA